MSRVLAFFLIKSAIFLSSLIFCQFLIFVLSQVPENLFHGLIKRYCWVAIGSGFVFDNLTFRTSESYFQVFKTFVFYSVFLASVTS